MDNGDELLAPSSKGATAQDMSATDGDREEDEASKVEKDSSLKNASLADNDGATTQRFYYQNPTTGDVSKTPLSIQQLIKLLVPVREGRSSILNGQTQCLPLPTNENGTSPNTASTETTETPQFGEWKAASEIEILREAACSQWYYHFKNSEGKAATTQGPVSCRTLVDLVHGAMATPADSTKDMLVYAANITAEWTPIDRFHQLQFISQVLQPTPAAVPSKVPVSGSNPTANASAKEVQDELEAFLSSTASAADANIPSNPLKEEDAQSYESDGGTRYVKDPFSSRWIHEALAPTPETEAGTGGKAQPTNGNETKATVKPSKKKKKAQFAKRNAKQWIYVTGLPTDQEISVADIQRFFGKVGMLDLDPETMQPKVKLYRTSPTEDSSEKLKGDASICYARPESVELALQVLDEAPWDANHKIHVQRATFEAKKTNEADVSDGNKRKRRNISQAQRKVAKLALLQAQEEGLEGERYLAGGRKGLHIVVVKNWLGAIPESEWEQAIQKQCQELGHVEKITCISETNVVLIKFVEPVSASRAVQEWHGQPVPGVPVDPKRPNLEVIYWDGVTDYTQKMDEAEQIHEEKARHDDFGKWLDEQNAEELPSEFQLQVAREG